MTEIIVYYKVPDNLEDQAWDTFVKGTDGDLLDFAMNRCSEWSVDIG